MKKYFNLILVVACSISMASCSDDNDEPLNPGTDPDNPTIAEGAFVLNQGSFYSHIEGSLSLIDYTNSSVKQNLFQEANGRSLGASPQAAVVYGSKVYIGVYESNVIQVIDRANFKSVKMISLEGETGQGPRSLVAHNGKVYISMFNGYVARLDTLSLAIDATVEVGPNPEVMAIKGKYLYVPNSDGMNYLVGYGTTASKIDLASFSVVKTFTVGLNPTAFACDGDQLYLLCMGDYFAVPGQVYVVDDADESTLICPATQIAAKGSLLYYINAPYGAPSIEYGIYNPATATTTPMIADEGVESPAAFGVDPVNGNIVIASYTMDGEWPSYTTDGYAKVYDSKGNFLKKYTVGVSPVAVFFNHK